MGTISGTSYARTHRASDSQQSAHETCLTSKKPPPTIVPAIPAPEHVDDYSAFAREKSPARLGSEDTFGGYIKNSAPLLANEFRATPTLLIGVMESQIPDDKVTLHALEAATTRSTSLESTKSNARHVTGLIHRYLDKRGETPVTLTGDSSLVLVRDLLESLAERGRTVHSAGKHALTVRPDALGIDWPMTNPLVLSAAIVESNEEPKQAPSMALETAKVIGQISTSAEVCVRKRAFVAGILLATYASLRFADVQRLRPFGCNEDPIRGALLSSGTKKPHGQNWPWAFPMVGLLARRIGYNQYRA